MIDMWNALIIYENLEITSVAKSFLRAVFHSHLCLERRAAGFSFGVNSTLLYYEKTRVFNLPYTYSTASSSARQLFSSYTLEEAMSQADRTATRLLEMADCLRTQDPEKVKMALKCVMACIKLELTPVMRAHVNLMYGKLLFYYTTEIDTAKKYLYESYNAMIQFGELFKEARLQALCLLCEISIYISAGTTIRQYLKNEMMLARKHPAVHKRMIFLLTEILINEKFADDAIRILDHGIKMCDDDPTLPVYFTITKQMVILRCTGKELEQHEIEETEQMLKNFDEASPEGVQLRLYFLCNQLVFWLSRGQAKTAKSLLKQVQLDCQTYASMPTPEGYAFADMEVITILALICTSVHALQTCAYEKAIKYCGIALAHIKSASTKYPYDSQLELTLDTMRLSVDEIMCHLHIIGCQPKQALSMIRSIIDYSSQYSQLGNVFYPIAHFLLANYAVYYDTTNEFADKHFKAAIKLSKDPLFKLRCHMQLAFFYLTKSREADYYSIADKVCKSLWCNLSPLFVMLGHILSFYHCYLNNKQNEFRQHILASLEMSKKDDLLRVYAITYQMFATYFVTPQNVLSAAQTVQWAKKGGDQSLLLWTNVQVANLLKSENVTDSPISLEEATKAVEDASTALQEARDTAAHDPEHLVLLEWINHNDE